MIEQKVNLGALTSLFDQDVEQYIIGGCLTDYRVFSSISAIVKPQDFYILRHRLIMSAMQDLYHQGEDIDMPMVAMRLKEQDKLDEIGGEPYLIACGNKAEYSSKHYEVFAYRVKALATKIKLLETGDKIKALASRPDLSLTALNNETQLALEQVFKDVVEKPAPTVGQAVVKFTEDLYEAETNGNETRLYTGYPEIDNPALIGGFRKTNLVVLGGDSGMGKTACSMNFAINFARDGNIGLIISKEMDEEEMARRFISIISDIPLIKLRKYSPQERDKMSKSFLNAITRTDDERARFGQAVSDLSKLPLLMRYMPNPTAIDIWSEARRVKQVYGRLDFLIVDLITDLPADEQDRNSNRAQELGNIAGRFKEMGAKKNLDCLVIVLSQIKPSVKQRNNKRPVKGDFQDSSAIGNQADVQLFFYRDVEYNEETEYPEQAEILVRKHRDGATGTALLHWEGQTTKLRSWSWFDNIRSKANTVIDDLNI